MKPREKTVNMKSWEMAYLLKNPKKGITTETPWKKKDLGCHVGKRNGLELKYLKVRWPHPLPGFN